VRDNPLDDIDHVRTLQLVIKDGRIVADHRVRLLQTPGAARRRGRPGGRRS
jgi:hypothetical protein